MSEALCDTSILIRLISGDDREKQDRAIALFLEVESGQVSLAAPDTVIADTVFVLTSRRLYNRSRREVAAKLTMLVRLPHFHVMNRSLVLRALELFGSTPYLDFGDAMIVAHMLESGERTVYSYDKDFDRVSSVTRREP